MGYGMSFYSGIPSNYQNGLYWAYLLQSMQQAQQMQQAQYEKTMQMFQQQNAAQNQSTNQTTQTTAAASSATAAQAPVDTIQTTNEQQTSASPQELSGDGKDDGKISAGQKAKNFFKGVGNFFKGMVCDDDGKFSIKRTLTTAAVAAGAVALTVATGGAATPFLVAAGATIGAVQTGKGVYNAISAKTDAQAEAAWQQIGSGATAIAGSVAGAKGALKSSGAAIPEGNAVTSSLKATRDCFKIAGEATLKGAKTLFTQSPIKTAASVRGYYQNTMKPNLEQAFSYKNGHKNYTDAMEQKFSKNIKDIEAEIKSLNDELAVTTDTKRIAQIQEQLAKLSDEKLLNRLRLDANNGKNKILSGIEEQISNVEAKLADPSLQAAEKARLAAQREQLYQMADVVDSKYKISFNKKLEAKEQYIQSLQERIKTANGDDKIALESELRMEKILLKGLKKQKQVEVAQHNVQSARADIIRLNDQLRTAATDAQKQSIASRIARIENAIVKDKQILRNANYMTAARKHLPDVGLSYGTYYLSNPAAQVEGNELSEADMIAQSYGFESAQAMQDYINSMQGSSQTENTSAQQQTTQQQTGTNRTANGLYPQPPVSSGLGFEELYASPYSRRY